MRRLVLGFVVIGREIRQRLFEVARHQGKAGAVILDIGELLAQRGHAQRHRNPVDDPGGGKRARRAVEPRMQPHQRARPVGRRHRGQVDPDKLGRAAADIDDQQLLGPDRHQRPAADHRQAGLFLGPDDLEPEAGLAPHLVQEGGTVAGPPAGFGRHQAHPPHPVIAELAPADPKGGDRPAHRRIGKSARCLQPLAQPDRARKAVDDVELRPLGLGDQHPAGIGAEVERGIKLHRVGAVGGRARDRLRKRARLVAGGLHGGQSCVASRLRAGRGARKGRARPPPARPMPAPAGRLVATSSADAANPRCTRHRPGLQGANGRGRGTNPWRNSPLSTGGTSLPR